jgi:hypothetical protein
MVIKPVVVCGHGFEEAFGWLETCHVLATVSSSLLNTPPTDIGRFDSIRIALVSNSDHRACSILAFVMT